MRDPIIGAAPGSVGDVMRCGLLHLMRRPSVSRIHLIECGAHTSAQWDNAALPKAAYTHGMQACSEGAD